jgi:hypothetical protein
VLAQRGDAVALLGLGSVGLDLERLDDHSDLDFFVVVDDDAAKQRYLGSIDWLEQLSPVVFSFENTVDGRKALFSDGLFAEYAVFTLAELRAASYPPPRLVWQRDGAPADVGEPGRRVPGPARSHTAQFHVNEALTNLYVGLHRDARGERLSATRFIQSYAVDQLLMFLDLTEPGVSPRQDVYVIERGAEQRFDAALLPLPSFVPGYDRNREAALAILDWLEARVDVDRALAGAIRKLTV